MITNAVGGDQLQKTHAVHLVEGLLNDFAASSASTMGMEGCWNIISIRDRIEEAMPLARERSKGVECCFGFGML